MSEQEHEKDEKHEKSEKLEEREKNDEQEEQEQHSTLEVDDSQFPEIDQHHFPEPIFPNQQPKFLDDDPNESSLPPRAAKRSRICGLRRKTLWIVIAIFLVIAAAVIGGAVGGTRGSKSSGSSTTSTATPTATNTPAPAPSNGVSSNSKLSTLYFLDANNVDHYRVFYQTSTKAIYQSAWNSSTQIWVPTPVTSADRDVKDSTSIAANIYYNSSSQIDFRIYFFDSKNHIQALSCDLSSVPCDGLWKSPADDPSNNFTASSASQLVYYGRECETCVDANFLVYEDKTGALQTYDTTNGSVAVAAHLNGFPQPVFGSALAVMPVFWISAIAVYFASNTFATDPDGGNYLQEATYLNGSWSVTRSFLTPAIPLNASIATFSLPSHQLHILYTNADNSSGGISVIELYSNNQWRNVSTPAVFASVPNHASMAANQAGRVYAVVKDQSTGWPAVMEWAFDGQSGYNQVGFVNTTGH